MPSKKMRDRILSIIVSLALSFFLWLAISGQDMSAVDISVPLELVSLPEDFFIKSELPTAVTFQLRANAAQVRFLTDRKPQLRLNVSTAREGHNIFPIPTDSLDLPRGVQVSKASPGVIEFELARVSSRVLSIRPVILGHPDPAYDLASVTIEPDVVTVEGPQELMKDLEYIATVPINIEGLNNDANMVALPALVDLDSALTVAPGELRVFINLDERMAEKTFVDLPIILVGDAGFDPAQLLMEPRSATVSVAWPVSARLELEPEALEIVVRVDTGRLAEEGGEMEAPVVVIPPVGVKVTAIDPVNVKIKANPPAPVSK